MWRFFGYYDVNMLKNCASRLIRGTYWLRWTLLQSYLISMIATWWHNIKGLHSVSWVHIHLQLQMLPTGIFPQYCCIFVFENFTYLMIIWNSSPLDADLWSMRKKVNPYWSVVKVGLERRKVRSCLCVILRIWEGELLLKGGLLSSKFWRWESLNIGLHDYLMQMLGLWYSSFQNVIPSQIFVFLLFCSQILF